MRAFRTANGGNVMLTFALATVPIVGLVGGAVDYSRANSDKAAMQAAIDATALMLSKNASTLTPDQIKSKATDYFNAQFHRTDVANIVITPTYTTTNGYQIVLTATGTVASAKVIMTLPPFAARNARSRSHSRLMRVSNAMVCHRRCSESSVRTRKPEV